MQTHCANPLRYKSRLPPPLPNPFIMSIIASLLLFLLSTPCLLGQTVREIQLRIGSGADAGMKRDGLVRVHMTNSQFKTCETPKLENPASAKSVLTENSLVSFSAGELGDCAGFAVPQRRLPVLELRHFGADALLVDWVRVVLDDRTYVECSDGGWVDNGQSMALTNCVHLVEAGAVPPHTTPSE